MSAKSAIPVQGGQRMQSTRGELLPLLSKFEPFPPVLRKLGWALSAGNSARTTVLVDTSNLPAEPGISTRTA
jgi:hypothetical protein